MKKLNDILNKKNAGRILFLLAITGITLVYLSGFIGKGEKEAEQTGKQRRYGLFKNTHLLHLR